MRGFGTRRRDRHRTGTSTETTLDTVRSGDEFEVLEIGDTGARISALRFGVAEGAQISCVTKIPAGPVVLRSGRQEIAVGRNLAQRIRVRHVGVEARTSG